MKHSLLALLLLSHTFLLALANSYKSHRLATCTTSTPSIRLRKYQWRLLRGGGAVEEQQPDQENIRQCKYDQASALRVEGKRLHDNGQWQDAAQIFAQAADSFKELEEYPEDQITCQLHHALCLIKCQEYEDCVTLCTNILENDNNSQSGAMRARALHRRSKAYLGLNRMDEALQDARSAAFLGDRKAVALYGKLMRDHVGLEQFENDGTNPAMLHDLLSGRNPFEASSSPLFESLLNKSPMRNTGTDSASGINPLASLLSGQGAGAGSLAKSVLSNLTKKLEAESDTICKFLNGASKEQLQSMAAMGGVPLSDQHASTIVALCQKVTPKRIRWTVKTSKRAWYVVSVIRKAMKLVQKYKILIVAWFVVAWIRASIVRPIPINKKAVLLAAKEAAKVVKETAVR